MRCGKGIQVYRGWLVSKSQPARMRCGKGIIYAFLSLHVLSQPARMRCGKDRPCGAHAVPNSRNPHECAVAKMEASGTSVEQQVATRTNALWQRCQSRQHQADGGVATRTNALWQRSTLFANPLSIKVATRTNALWQSRQRYTILK